MSCCCIPLQLALMLVLTIAPCAGGVFPSSSWRKYSTCTRGGHHLLQLALVVFFLPTTGANALLALVQLALCGGGCMWWWYIYVVVVSVAVYSSCSTIMGYQT